MNDFVKKNGKNIVACVTVSSLVVSGVFAIANFELIGGVFNPDKYSDLLKNNDYDTSTYGIPGENDNSYDDTTKDDNAANKANQNNQEQHDVNLNQNNIDGGLSPSGSTTVLGGVIGDQNLGTNGNVAAGGNNPIHIPNNDNGNNTGDSDNKGDNENENPNPDSITITGNPEIEQGGANPDRFVYDTYVSLSVEMNSVPSYYAGEKIDMTSYKKNIKSAISTIYNAQTKENVMSDVIDNLQFYDETLNDGVSQKEADSLLGSHNLIVIYKKNGTAGTPITSSVPSYITYLYGVTINDIDNSKTIESRLLTNDKIFSLDNYYQQVITSLKNDSSFINDDGSLNKTFQGWYVNEDGKAVASTNDYDFKERVGAITLQSAGFKSVESDYVVKLIDNQQTLVGYTGSDEVLKVPEGVSSIALDKKYINKNVKTIELSSAVNTIDYNSLYNTLPSFAQYKISELNSYYACIDGILYNKDYSKILNIPHCYWNNNDSLVLEDTVNKIGKYAFLGVKDNKYLRINQEAIDINGLANIPNNMIIQVNDSDNDLTYIRYLAMLEDNITIEVKDKDLDNLYLYKDGNVYYKSLNKLVYTLKIDNGVVVLPDDVESIGKNAFIDIKEDIKSLQISKNVQYLDEYVMSGLVNLSTVIVQDASKLVLGGKLFNDNDIPSNLLNIYLSGISEKDSLYDQWVNALNNVFSDGSSHLVCNSSDIYIDSNGAIYIEISKGDYKLISMPQNITEFILPSDINVVAIGANAISGCDNLKLIELPESISTIDNYAFDNCNSLEVLIVPRAIKQACIDETALLSTIKLVASEDEVYKDGDYVYYNNDKSSLLAVLSDYNSNTLVIDDNTLTIEKRAVMGCTSIQEVFANNLENIRDEAFKDCTFLKSLPTQLSREKNDYKYIGKYAFNNCINITKVVLDCTNVQLGDYAFGSEDENYDSKLDTVEITGSITSIGKGVFANNKVLASASFNANSNNDSLISSGVATFKGCSILSLVNFDISINEIGDYSFYDCTLLSKINFSSDGESSLKRIGNYAFYNNFDNTSVRNFLPFKSLEYIGNYAFYNCIKTQSINVVSTVKEIGDYAFSLDDTYSSSLITVNVNSNSKLERIGDGAFKNNLSLVTFEMSNARNTNGIILGNNTFENCISLTYTIWGNQTIKSIGDNCFAGCIKLLDASIGTQSYLTSIGKGAFAGCSSIELADFSYATSLTNIPSELFGEYVINGNTRRCDSLKKVVLGSKVNTIESKAFVGARALTLLEILNSKTVIESADDIFYKGSDVNTLSSLLVSVPTSLNNSLYNSYVEKWHDVLTVSENDQDTFYDDIIASSYDSSKLFYNGGSYERNEDGNYILLSMSTSKDNGVLLLNNTIEIADGAFKNCSAITSIRLPNTLTKIGKKVFENCTSLEALVFQGKEEINIEDSLFNGTKVNDNFRIYIPSNTASMYYASPYLKEFNFICTGDAYWLDSLNGAVYAMYSSDSNLASGGYLYQLMYVPRVYDRDFFTISLTRYIYKEALKGCAITSFNISTENLIAIGDYALANCSNLQTVDLYSYFNTSSLDSLGEGVFENCTSLKNWYTSSGTVGNIVQIDSVSKMGKGVFKGCTSIETARWYTKNLSEIPESTFEGCTSLSYLSFGASLTAEGYPIKSFGKRCFAGCTSFTTQAGSLASFSGLETIGEECYEGCSNMSILIFPTALKNIGNNAFARCDMLSVIAMSSDVPLDLSNSGISKATWAKVSTYIPEGLKNTYLNEWNKQGIGSPKLTIDSSKMYRSISGNIYGCDDPTWNYYGFIKNNVFHSGLIFAGAPTIGEDGLVKIYGSTSYRVTGIAQGAFEGNNDLVTFKGNFTASNKYTYCFMETISDNAFKDCINLKSVEMLSSSVAYSYLTTIGNHAFDGCISLEEYDLAWSVTSIGSYAFANTNKNFVLDATRIFDPSKVTLNERIFGDNIGENIKIRVTTINQIDAFILAWGNQLKEEYGLTNQQLLDLFEYDINAVDESMVQESNIQLSDMNQNQSNEKVIENDDYKAIIVTDETNKETSKDTNSDEQ